MAWEKNDDPAEQEGKGVALKSCTQFFTWLQEAEEEDDQTGRQLLNSGDEKLSYGGGKIQREDFFSKDKRRSQCCEKNERSL